jgi:hypothetical protein
MPTSQTVTPRRSAHSAAPDLAAAAPAINRADVAGGDAPATMSQVLATVQDGVARATVAVGLGALIVMHAVDGVAKYTETRYIFWMYMAAIAASLVCGAVLLFSRTAERQRLALLAAAGIAGSVFLGYVVSRTTGMPNATGDIGNWTEPLGLASIVAEAMTVLAAIGALVLRRRSR